MTYDDFLFEGFMFAVKFVLLPSLSSGLVWRLASGFFQSSPRKHK